MKQFFVGYYSNPQNMNPDPEQGKKQQEVFFAWVKSLGSTMVNPGVPLGSKKVIRSNSVSDEGEGIILFGYSIIQAESIDAAVQAVQKCPFLEMGEIRLAELMSM